MTYWPGTKIPKSTGNAFDLSTPSPWTEAFLSGLRKSQVTSGNASKAEKVNIVIGKDAAPINYALTKARI